MSVACTFDLLPLSSTCNVMCILHVVVMYMYLCVLHVHVLVCIACTVCIVPYIGYISTHENSRVSNIQRLEMSDTWPRVILPCIV